MLDKYGLQLGNAIMAEDKHLALYQAREHTGGGAFLGAHCLRCADPLSAFVSQELVDKYPVEYIAGGATQNALRVAQWMLQCSGAASYVVRLNRPSRPPSHLRPHSAPPSHSQGAVGQDEFASLQAKVASKDGLRTYYLQVDGSPTGKCAVLVVDGERSLVASLGAAEQYKARVCRCFGRASTSLTLPPAGAPLLVPRWSTWRATGRWWRLPVCTTSAASL